MTALEHDTEPDYRFTLANERTFLAWIRTALALIAGGVALAQLLPMFGVAGLRRGLSVSLILAGGLLATAAVRRWRRVQHAMRRSMDLPATRLPLVLATALSAMTVVLLVLLFVAAPADL